jgi:hypothetical protein
VDPYFSSFPVLLYPVFIHFSGVILLKMEGAVSSLMLVPIYKIILHLISDNSNLRVSICPRLRKKTKAKRVAPRRGSDVGNNDSLGEVD